LLDWIDSIRQIHFTQNVFLVSVAVAFVRETIMVTLVNFFTGIFVGFAVFGFLGYLAWKLDTTIDGVVDSGRVVFFWYYDVWT